MKNRLLLLSSLICISQLASRQGLCEGESAPSSVLENLKFVPGDEEGNEKKALKAELLVSSAEQQAVVQIQKLLKKYKGSPLEPDLLFRLAEMYMRKSKTDRFFEIHRESETMIKLAPRLLTKASSRTTLLQAVDVYQSLQKKYPTYTQMDLVIFNHAFARQALAQDNDAEKLYWSLIQHFPDSPLVADAHLAIGEISFQKGLFAHALEHFEAIRKYPESRVFPYGLYKGAWTHYNMRNAPAALKNLEEVVAYGNHVAKEDLDAKLDLRKEALGDMILFFEDVYTSKEAYTYFNKQAGETDLPPILIRLSELYDRHARYQDEREVLTRFVDEQPSSAIAPEAIVKLVYAADALKDKPQAVADLESFASTCLPKSRFSKAHPEAQMSCLQELQKTSLAFAEKWLKTWNKNPNDESFADNSEKAFEIYLRNKKSDEEYGKSHYLYAELLFKRKKYRRASEEYASVSLEAHDKLKHDAEYAACLSLEKAVGDKWSEKDEKSFHSLAQSYVKDNPKGKFRLEIEYKMAILAYEKERYDEAAPIFLVLGKQFAKEEKGQKSQDLYLDILNIKKDYAGIRGYAKDLLKSPGTPERSQKIAKLYEQAYFLEIQKIEEKGDLKLALHEYQQFTHDNPKSELAEKAHWNEMQLQFKTGDGFAGAQSSIQFSKLYPKSEHVTPALARAAQMLESMAQLVPAAQVLMQIAEREEANKAKWQELAADFYALSGHAPAARHIYQDLLSASKESEKNRLLQKLEVFEKAYGQADSQAMVYKQLIQHDVAPYPQNLRIDHLKKLLNEGDATAAFNESKKMLGSSSFSSLEKAEIRLVQARVLEDEFFRQSVKSKGERLAMVLAIKTEKLEKAQAALQSVIKYGDSGIALQAMEHLYQCYDHYVTALKTIPPPDGMSPAEVQAFNQELQNLIMPLEEKGVDTLAQALSFAKKNRILDGTIVRLEDELAKANRQPATVTHVAVTMPSMLFPVKEWSSL
jgi:TolA-binding protein